MEETSREGDTGTGAGGPNETGYPTLVRPVVSFVLLTNVIANTHADLDTTFLHGENRQPPKPCGRPLVSVGPTVGRVGPVHSVGEFSGYLGGSTG